MELKTKEQIKIEIEKLQKQLKELDNKDYQEIKYKNKTFRIYKWENKFFKDFPMPKGFKWCEYFDFVDLINNGKIDLEKYPVDYYIKNPFKENIKKGWKLSVLVRDRDLGLAARFGVLADSYSNGRVVVAK